MFKAFVSVVLATLAFVLSVSAHALVPATWQGTWKFNDAAPIYSTPETACSTNVPADRLPYLGISSVNRIYNPTSGLLSQGRCMGTDSEGYSSQFGLVNLDSQSQVCPANSTAVSGGCQCDSGFNESGGQCVAPTNACTPNKGKVSVVNWTVGFTRSGDAADTATVGPANTFPPTNEVCNGGCIMVGDPYGVGSQAWKSQAPTPQGLYRLSMDVPMTNSGDTCTGAAKDAPAVPTTPEPNCPGYVGEVNGKLGCYGTAEKPVATTPGQTPPPGAPAAGNPAAGPKPATGEGSGTGSAGRTPATGSGGNAGGPAGAAVGGTGTRGGGAQATGGTGTVSSAPSGEEQAPCGAPGQPVCAVKVDETGTPAASGTSFDSGNAALDTNKGSAQEAINSAHAIQAPAWSFSFQLPTGCSSYQVGGGAIFKGVSFTLNPCAYQSTIHDLMSMIWAAVTAFCIISMVGRTIRES